MMKKTRAKKSVQKNVKQQSNIDTATKNVDSKKQDDVDIKNKELKNIVDEKPLDTFKSNILNLKKIDTLNRLTKYEKTRIKGTRASQIQNGMSPIFLKDNKIIKLPEEFKDFSKNSIDLANLELTLKSCPLIIKRNLIQVI